MVFKKGHLHGAAWHESVSKPRAQDVKDAISKAQKGRKHLPGEGFQKGHPVFGGHKTRFTKGQESWNKGKEATWAKKHGMSGTNFYRRWLTIGQRCNNYKTKQYKDYGGRGICVEWRSFEEFMEDMYESYIAHVNKHGNHNTTIERINNNGNYSKSNCKWATKSEQMWNTRRNKLV